MAAQPVPRLTVLVLIALILGGGGSLPLLDALSHGSGQVYGSPHFETGADSHRDFCSLGASPPLATHLSALDFDLAFGGVAFPDMAFHAAAPRSADLGLLPQPRAPPSLPA